MDAADVHDAWAAWMTYEGAAQHPSIREFTDPQVKVQAEDTPFLEAIRLVAQRRASETDSPSHAIDR